MRTLIARKRPIRDGRITRGTVDYAHLFHDVIN